MRRVNLTGQMYGFLKVLCFVRQEKSHAIWEARCTAPGCGVLLEVRANALRTGNTTSCGCQKRLRTRLLNLQHGESGSDENEIWKGMRARCNDKQNPSYGGVGITVCERWQEFVNFLEDMGRRPSKQHSLERIDVRQGYSKENCRWATRTEQARNRRDTIYVEYKGVRIPLAEAAERSGVLKKTILCRLASGWMGDRVFTPVAIVEPIAAVPPKNPLEEEWRNTAFDGYQVSSFGRVVGPFGKPTHGFKIDQQRAYLAVCIRGRNRLVHRLVAEAFCGLQPEQVANHRDNNPANNHWDNLEVGTQAQNLAHAASQGRLHGSAKLTPEQIAEIQRSEGPLKYIAEKFGISTTHVRRLREGQCWKHLSKQEPTP